MRGPSKAVIKAEKYAIQHPEISAAELAKKFGLNEATVYRSAWYKEHRAKQKVVNNN